MALSKPPGLKVAPESHREEIFEVARLHDARAREAERESLPSANVLRVAVKCREQRRSIGRFTVRPGM